MSTNIFLYVPNLIGYARIVLALFSFWYMIDDYVTTTFLYVLSSVLDAFDGYAARYLNQSTKFGAILDMLTDRCATMGLLVALGHFYPSWMFVFQISMTIDIASHWMHTQVSLMQGNSSHKSIDLSKNKILFHYYTNRKILFSMCAGNELFYCALYLLHFTTGPALFGIGVWHVLALATLPVAVVKSGISVVHLYAASINVAIIDEQVADKQQ